MPAGTTRPAVADQRGIEWIDLAQWMSGDRRADGSGANDRIAKRQAAAAERSKRRPTMVSVASAMNREPAMGSRSRSGHAAVLDA
jgi:hypothetical protein